MENVAPSLNYLKFETGYRPTVKQMTTKYDQSQVCKE